MLIEDAKKKAASLGCGIALYAMRPGGGWTLEVLQVETGETFQFKGETVEECALASGLVEEKQASEPPAPVEPEIDDPFS